MRISGIVTREEWRKAWNENWQRADLESVEIFVAYCSRSGVDEIIAAHQNQKPKLRLVVGINNGVTDLQARDALFKWGKENSHIETRTRGSGESSGIFHPKVYVFHFADAVRILIGSVNLTHGAFNRNTEATIEWQMSSDEWRANDLRQTIEAWWRRSKALQAPSLEERIIDTMNHGVLVTIEVHLKEARLHITKDTFEIGGEINEISGAIEVARLSSTFIKLIGTEIFDKLEAYRQQAHSNCHKFSIPTQIGRFVPVTAIKKWEAEHMKIERQFKEELKCFDSKEGRKKVYDQLKAQLPGNIKSIWAKLGKPDDIPDEKLNAICTSALKKYEKRAPEFSRTIVLSTFVTQHPFPQMWEQTVFKNDSPISQQKFADEDCSIESTLDRSELSGQIVREFTDRNVNGITLSWILGILKRTRRLIADALNKYLALSKPSKPHTKSLDELSEQLHYFNFYGDNFCQEVANTIVNNPSRAAIEQLKNQALQDLKNLDSWPKMSHEDVIRSFNDFVDWKQADIFPKQPLHRTRTLSLEF